MKTKPDRKADIDIHYGTHQHMRIILESVTHGRRMITDIRNVMMFFSPESVDTEKIIIYHGKKWDRIDIFVRNGQFHIGGVVYEILSLTR